MTGAESKSFPSSPIRVSIQKLLSHAYKEEITWNWEEFSYTYFTICIAFKFNGLGGVFFLVLQTHVLLHWYFAKLVLQGLWGEKKNLTTSLDILKRLLTLLKSILVPKITGYPRWRKCPETSQDLPASGEKPVLHLSIWNVTQCFCVTQSPAQAR